MILFLFVLNESYDFEDSSVDFMFEFRQVDLLLLKEREGFWIIEELVHLAVNLVIVLSIQLV